MTQELAPIVTATPPPPASLIRERDPCGDALILRDPLFGNPKAPYHSVRGLLAILSWKRPFDTDGEELFARTYLDPIPGMTQDTFRNRMLHIPHKDGTASRVMFASHIDTCHREEGYQRLAIILDETGRPFARTRKGEGNCLGADDGTGVWLMLEMIAAKRPGKYFFHRGEEVGCKGSRWIVANNPDALANIDAAIAFDRRDFTNIITHQGGERGCSEAFATSLAAQLPGFKADPTGLYTDTKQYFRKISECTNISVGYQDQHGPLERQYLDFADSIRTALLALDTTTLTIARDPSTTEYDRPTSNVTYYQNGVRTEYHRGGSYRYDNDENNLDPTHHIHRPTMSHSFETHVWSRKLTKNLLRSESIFVYGSGYLPLTPENREAARTSKPAPQQLPLPSNIIGAPPKPLAETEAPDLDELSEADRELYSIQFDIDSEKTLAELALAYPSATAKILEDCGIEITDLLQIVYGEAFFDLLDEHDDAAAGIDSAEDSDDADDLLTEAEAMARGMFPNNESEVPD